MRRTCVVAWIAVLAVACADKPSAPATRAGRLQFAVRAGVVAQPAAARTINVDVGYRRTGGARVTLATAQTPVSSAGGGATQDVVLELDLAACLADQERTGARGACTLHVDVVLRDGAQRALDSIAVEPFEAVPGVSPVRDVELAEVVSLTLPSDTATVEVGDSRSVVPVLRDASGRTLQRTVEYVVSDPAVASVSFGVATFTAPGSVGITAKYGDITDTFTASSKLSFTQMSTKHNTSCGRTKYGTIYCWGVNVGGVFGAAPEALVPTAASGGQRFEAAGLGQSHVCAANSAWRIHCWGANTFGQLGTGSTAPAQAPTPIASTIQFSDGGIGDNHACALAQFGQLHCWGNNASGQLGNNTTTNALTPVAVVQPNRQFETQAVGPSHTCGVTINGFVNCWGANGSGQLGDGTTIPRLVPAGITVFQVPFRDVTTGDGDNTCATSNTFVAYCWGRNDLGQLGDGSVVNRSVATLVAGGLQFETLTPGATHTCGVTTAGVGYCWGNGTNGELGTGVAASSLVPVPVSGGLTFISVQPGERHSCGLTTGSQVFCWGDGANGRLGTGTTASSLVPVKVAGQR